MAYQLGCFNRPWSQLRYEEALRGIAEAGFSHTGLMRQQGELLIGPEADDDQVAYVNNAVAEAGLQMSTVLGTFDLSGCVDRAVAELGTLLKKCAAVSAEYFLSCGVGDEAKREAYYEVMREGAAIGAELGVMVTLKPHGGISMHGADLLQAVEAIAHPNFGIYYDPGNMLYYGGFDPVEEARLVAPHVVGICVKDCTGHQEGVELLPGEGMVDFGGVFDALRDGGFDHGPVLVECLGGEGYQDLTARAKQTYAFLEQLLG